MPIVYEVVGAPFTSISADHAAAPSPAACVHGAPDGYGCVPCDQAAARAARRGRPAVERERRAHVAAELALLDRVADAERKLAIVEARERDTATLLESQRRTIDVQKENLAALDARIRQMSAPSDRLYQERESLRQLSDLERSFPSTPLRHPGVIQRVRHEIGPSAVAGVQALAPRHRVRRHTAVLYCQNEED